MNAVPPRRVGPFSYSFAGALTSPMNDDIVGLASIEQPCMPAHDLDHFEKPSQGQPGWLFE